MAIGLLATGDEIIQGDTLNTNSNQLAKSLYSEGLVVGLHLACSDNEQEIQDCLKFLAINHDIILITGGLGPTSDDRTRFALARFMGEELVEFPAALAHVQERLLRSNLALTAGNKQQALFPREATLLPNPFGTALGCYCYAKDKLLVLLPGPPRECIPMFEHHIMPLLQKTQHNDKQQLKWRLFGVAEGQIAQQLDDALKCIDCETGYRLETPYVECKVRCNPTLIEQVQAIVEPIIRPHIIATPEKKASDVLREKINQSPFSINIDDEVSGGIVQTLIQCPQNAARLKFNTVKGADFNFQAKGLDEYWSNQQQAGSTTIHISYEFEGNKGEETHTLPYRSAMVVHFAAEWLCFRILHLINQLHQGVA